METHADALDRVEQQWKDDKAAAVLAIRGLFSKRERSRELLSPIKASGVFEELTGIKPLSSEEMRTLQVYRDAMHSMVSSGELSYGLEWDISVGSNFEPIEEAEG